MYQNVYPSVILVRKIDFSCVGRKKDVNFHVHNTVIFNRNQKKYDIQTFLEIFMKIIHTILCILFKINIVDILDHFGLIHKIWITTKNFLQNIFDISR